MTNRPIRTLIIDPYPLSRYGIAALLSEQSEFAVVQTLASPMRVTRSLGLDLAVVQVDGATDGHDHLTVPTVEVRIRDNPRAVLAAVRSAVGVRTMNPLQPDGPLTQRELEVVALVADGRTDHEIAEALFLSVRTVRSHLDRIRAKTGRRRRADLTRWYVEQRDA